jgi:hypothetical protein
MFVEEELFMSENRECYSRDITNVAILHMIIASDGPLVFFYNNFLQQRHKIIAAGRMAYVPFGFQNAGWELPDNLRLGNNKHTDTGMFGLPAVLIPVPVPVPCGPATHTELVFLKIHGARCGVEKGTQMGGLLGGEG